MEHPRERLLNLTIRIYETNQLTVTEAGTLPDLLVQKEQLADNLSQYSLMTLESGYGKTVGKRKTFRSDESEYAKRDQIGSDRRCRIVTKWIDRLVQELCETILKQQRMNFEMELYP